MYFEQFYLGCLAHASYLLASDGEAVVVDPQRDVDLYVKAAAEHGLAIRHIFETHLHADFVSGPGPDPDSVLGMRVLPETSGNVFLFSISGAFANGSPCWPTTSAIGCRCDAT